MYREISFTFLGKTAMIYCDKCNRRKKDMLTQQELRNSPLFQGIDQREYLAMVSCFQAVRKTY